MSAIKMENSVDFTRNNNTTKLKVNINNLKLNLGFKNYWKNWENKQKKISSLKKKKWRFDPIRFYKFD